MINEKSFEEFFGKDIKIPNILGENPSKDTYLSFYERESGLAKQIKKSEIINSIYANPVTYLNNYNDAIKQVPIDITKQVEKHIRDLNNLGYSAEEMKKETIEFSKLLNEKYMTAINLKFPKENVKLAFKLQDDINRRQRYKKTNDQLSNNPPNNQSTATKNVMNALNTPIMNNTEINKQSEDKNDKDDEDIKKYKVTGSLEDIQKTLEEAKNDIQKLENEKVEIMQKSNNLVDQFKNNQITESEYEKKIKEINNLLDQKMEKIKYVKPVFNLVKKKIDYYNLLKQFNIEPNKDDEFIVQNAFVINGVNEIIDRITFENTKTNDENF